MASQHHITVGHHFSDKVAPFAESGLPHWAHVRRLPAESPFPIPDDVEMLFVLPPRAGGLVLPADPPPGWPFKLRFIQSISAGIDEYPSWLFQGPPMATARGATAVPIAEFVLAAMLAFEKAIPNIWIDKAEDWRQSSLGTLQGKTLGLIGFGAIGQAVATRALPFGMRVLALRRGNAAPDMAGVEGADLARLMALSDHIVLAAPLTAETREIVSAASLAGVKPGAHLVNIARGGLVDHAALIAALDDGRLAAATLDVTEPEPPPAGDPLYRHPRIRLSPHMSWSGGTATGGGLRAILLENLERFRDGRPLNNLVKVDAGY